MRVLSSLLVSCLFLSAGAYARTVQTDYDSHANLRNYHTYSWTALRTSDPVLEQYVKDIVDDALRARGWQELPMGGQVAIAVVGATRADKEYQTFYRELGDCRVPSGIAPGKITLGSLVVNVYDAETRTLIWRGIAGDTFSGNQGNVQKNLDRAVFTLFKSFPSSSSR